MGIESHPINQFRDTEAMRSVESEIEHAPRSIFRYSSDNFVEECVRLEDNDLVTMAKDLRTSNRRYLNIVMVMESGDKSPSTDVARTRIHNGVISTLGPLTRALGGNFATWFTDTFVNSLTNQPDRNKVAVWALNDALETLQGELNQYEQELAKAG